MKRSSTSTPRLAPSRRSNARRQVKIGIDVGGTFTHAVALDATSLRLIGKAMVPTTHTAKTGVAAGVVASMKNLMASTGIHPEEVVLIAHSTTQATNALLEGDVAPVGIIGMSPGRDMWRAKDQSSVRRLELAPGKFLPTYHRFFDSSDGIEESAIQQLVRELKEEGAEVFVVTEAYGIEDLKNERRAAEIIRGMGYPVTAASEISELYGLRVRTRTAVINACMLPKMLETANLTEKSVRKAGIKSPLMIMRSDGGIMSIDEMRRRPILTMLSGPAAGVAAALMYVKISDGLFFEVGGTSTDVSIIKNGRPMVRSAEVGGHRLYVRTLDIRTIGIGGGSMVRMKGKSIVDVGPRSAHIAGLGYPSFSVESELGDSVITKIQPRASDPDDYVAIRTRSDLAPAYALTTTDAANMLGAPLAYAKGNPDAVARLAASLSEAFGVDAKTLVLEILNKAAQKAAPAGQQFIKEYELDPSLLTCVGGGGGAEVIVPFVASRLGMKHSIAENAEVISAIGVALGMIRDTIERSVVSPSAADILRIRADAEASVARMGASPDSIDVFVEVDTRQKKLLATATGVSVHETGKVSRKLLSDGELRSIAASSFGDDSIDASIAGGNEFFTVVQAEVVRKQLLGLFKRVLRPVRVLDKEGVVRLKLSHAEVHKETIASLLTDFTRLVDEFTTFGDAGGLEPDVFVLVRHRVVDLSGLVGKDQMLSLLRTELERFDSSEPALVLISRKE